VALKVFIMWSEESSRKVAEALYEFLKSVLQAPDYFISTEDVEAGQLWSNVIAGELEATHIGIACLTKQNLNSRWIHFESGAISKVSEKSKVMPYLIGVKKSDVEQPLAKFQMVKADKSGTRRLVKSLIAESSMLPWTPDEKAVMRSFSALWDELREVISSSAGEHQNNGEQQPQRADEDLMVEILSIVRRMERESTQTEGHIIGRHRRPSRAPRQVPVALDGQTIRLPEKEAELLLFLQDNPRVEFNRAALSEELNLTKNEVRQLWRSLSEKLGPRSGLIAEPSTGNFCYVGQK